MSSLRADLAACLLSFDSHRPRPSKLDAEVVQRILDGGRGRGAALLDEWPGVALRLASFLGLHPDATLIQVARLLGLGHRSALGYHRLSDVVLGALAHHRGPIDVSEFQSVLIAAHLETEGLISLVLELDDTFEHESSRRLLEDHPGEVVAALAANGPQRAERAKRGLARVLGRHSPSVALATELVPYVLQVSRDVAPGLRRALASVPVDVLAQHLRAGDYPTRQAAAAWLAERRDPLAIPALHEALKKEKHEPTYAALIGALESCGAPNVLDEATLEKRATKSLSKGWPAALAFLEPASLPALHWKDGSLVPPAIAQAWLVDGHKSKSVEPSALVQVVATRIVASDRHAFARAILERFIAWDTRIPEDLGARDEERVSAALGHWAEGQTREELLARTDARLYGLPVSSAVAEKGVLGVVAALGGADLVPSLEAFVRTHRGFRASQSRAMLTVLAFLDAPRATQTLLRIAASFRTPGIRKEAALLVDTLAARKGWTLAELSDRTVPTAGLDDDGALTLIVGRAAGDEVIETRRFIARIDASDALVLESSDGIRIAALPDARKDEDAAVTAAAKKAFATAKKDLKTILVTQRERLYEAMLAARRWSLADFRAYFLQHPIVGRLAARTLFIAYEGDSPIASFRPAGDGTFVGLGHDTVSLLETATVGIAHSVLLAPGEDAAWADHLADYELVSVFPQLGRERYVRASDASSTQTLIASETSVLAVQLRSRAKRAGFTEHRGDGGYIDAFVKPLATMGRVWVIETEGVPPDVGKDDQVIIHGLSVCEAQASVERGAPLRVSTLSEVERAEASCTLRALLT